MSSSGYSSVSDLVLEALVRNADVSTLLKLGEVRNSRVAEEVARQARNPTKRYVVNDTWVTYDEMRKGFNGNYKLDGTKQTRLALFEDLELEIASVDCLKQSFLPVAGTCFSITKKLVIRTTDQIDQEELECYAEILENCPQLAELVLVGAIDRVQKLVSSLNLEQTTPEEDGKIKKFNLKLGRVGQLNQETIEILLEKIGNRELTIAFNLIQQSGSTEYIFDMVYLFKNAQGPTKIALWDRLEDEDIDFFINVMKLAFPENSMDRVKIQENSTFQKETITWKIENNNCNHCLVLRIGKPFTRPQF